MSFYLVQVTVSLKKKPLFDPVSLHIVTSNSQVVQDSDQGNHVSGSSLWGLAQLIENPLATLD